MKVSSICCMNLSSLPSISFDKDSFILEKNIIKYIGKNIIEQYMIGDSVSDVWLFIILYIF